MNAYAPETLRPQEHVRPHAVVRPLLLMVLVGAHFAIQHTWTLPEFTVPDCPEV